TALVGVRATGRTAVALGAAALYAFWPFISGLIGGHRAWGNGTWNVDVGLHLYTEPLSTALVVSAIAICLAPQMTDVGLAAAGGLLSFASVVRLSNAVIAAAVLVVIAVRVGARRAVLFMLALASFAAIEAAYWFKGYLHLAAHE